MNGNFSSTSVRDRVQSFEEAQREIACLDGSGKDAQHLETYRQYQRRNSFGLDPSMKIYRIFQQQYFDYDQTNNCLTLPRATSNVWKDSLENPLASVFETDQQTGLPLHLGSVVSQFYALCWTNRAKPTSTDWASFSHGTTAIRIGTTVGKLIDRVMSISDQCYMHRSWLVDVEYRCPRLIQQMQTSSEVCRRMESTGSMLALSAAVVRTDYSGEDEVRLLFDNGIHPQWSAVTASPSSDLIRIPFDWNGFVDEKIYFP